MEKEFLFGKMETNMKGNGKMIKKMEKDNWFIKMAKNIMENGKMIIMKAEEF